MNPRKVVPTSPYPSSVLLNMTGTNCISLLQICIMESRRKSDGTLRSIVKERIETELNYIGQNNEDFLNNVYAAITTELTNTSS